MKRPMVDRFNGSHLAVLAAISLAVAVAIALVAIGGSTPAASDPAPTRVAVDGSPKSPPPADAQVGDGTIVMVHRAGERGARDAVVVEDRSGKRAKLFLTTETQIAVPAGNRGMVVAGPAALSTGLETEYEILGSFQDGADLVRLSVIPPRDSVGY